MACGGALFSRLLLRRRLFYARAARLPLQRGMPLFTFFSTPSLPRYLPLPLPPTTYRPTQYRMIRS